MDFYSESKIHVKMYKSGKSWCVAAVAFFALMSFGSVQKISADATPSAVQESTQNNNSLSFDNSLAVNSYLANGTKIYKDSTGTDLLDTVSTDNVAVLSYQYDKDGRVLVKNTSNNEVGYVDKSAINANPWPAKFDDSTAVNGYIQKNTNLYKDDSSNDILDTAHDNNIQILYQNEAHNGRVLVKILTSNTVAYVNQTDISSSPQVVNDNNGINNYTRSDMNSIPDSLKNSDVWAPQTIPSNLKQDFTTVIHDENTGKDSQVLVWDSWPVTNPDGTVANYHGYRLVIGLTTPTDSWWARMGMFAQKISDNSNDFSTWQYVGHVFDSVNEGQPQGQNDNYLNQVAEEWSGSAAMIHPDDTTLRVFYTTFSSAGQVLTTAQIAVEPKDGNDWNSGLTIDHSKTTDHRSLFAGDEKYQSPIQTGSPLPGQNDSFSLRDPHIIYDGDQPYLVFEANTGLNTGYQGINNLYNKAYFGESDAEFAADQKQLLDSVNSAQYDKAFYANATLGFMKLNQDFTVESVENPLMSFNGVTDEVERPNLFEYDGKWYLFGIGHGWHMASNNDDITGGKNGAINYMYGFVSDDGIQGHYRPLNGNGLVLASDLSDTATNKAFIYSYLVLPNSDPNNNQFVVTCYLNSKTFGPSFLLEIDGDKTKVINDKWLDQGALVDNHHYYSLTGDVINATNSTSGQSDANNSANNTNQSNSINNTNQSNSTNNTSHSNSTNNTNQSNSTNNTNQSNSTNNTNQSNSTNNTNQSNSTNNTNQSNSANNTNQTNNVEKSAINKSSWNGYILDPDVNGYRWFDNGQLYTGFQNYMGAYYYFVDGVRQQNQWESAWGLKYYVGDDGRTVEGIHAIDGHAYDFGTDGTFNVKGPASGYLNDGKNWMWYEDSNPYTGFRYYMGSYYWFENGLRQDNAWHEAWGLTYYTGADGRAVQGVQNINGRLYYFGNDGTFFMRTNQEVNDNGTIYYANADGSLTPKEGYIWDGSSANGGYRWYEDGQLYTGFRYHMGTYYWFVDGVRQNQGWRQAWGLTYWTDADGRAVQGNQSIDGKNYYFGNDGTYYLR